MKFVQYFSESGNILVLIRRDGNISHLFISLATQRSMGELLFLSPKSVLSQSCLNIHTGVERPPRYVDTLYISHGHGVVGPPIQDYDN